MNAARVIFALARADFLERVRRYSFFLTLLFALGLGYGTATGRVSVSMDGYRGVYTSAWIGALVALVTTCFVTLVGFYIIKGSVDRDRHTGVGQILAATPLSKPSYTLGKFLSNFGVLASMVLLLAVCALVMQLFAAEDPHIDSGALLLPFFLIALPAMALTSAMAVLFEMLPVLRGGVGNILWFFVWVFGGIALPDLSKNPHLDPMGFAVVSGSMMAAARQVIPGYKNNFALDMSTAHVQLAKGLVWQGVEWTRQIVELRLAWFAAAIVIALLAALFFDRFDSARALGLSLRRTRVRKPMSVADGEVLPTAALDALLAAPSSLASYSAAKRACLASLDLTAGRTQRHLWPPDSCGTPPGAAGIAVVVVCGCRRTADRTVIRATGSSTRPASGSRVALADTGVVGDGFPGIAFCHAQFAFFFFRHPRAATTSMLPRGSCRDIAGWRGRRGPATTCGTGLGTGSMVSRCIVSSVACPRSRRAVRNRQSFRSTTHRAVVYRPDESRPGHGLHGCRQRGGNTTLQRYVYCAYRDFARDSVLVPRAPAPDQLKGYPQLFNRHTIPCGLFLDTTVCWRQNPRRQWALQGSFMFCAAMRQTPRNTAFRRIRECNICRDSPCSASMRNAKLAANGCAPTLPRPSATTAGAPVAAIFFVMFRHRWDRVSACVPAHLRRVHRFVRARANINFE